MYALHGMVPATLGRVASSFSVGITWPFSYMPLCNGLAATWCFSSRVATIGAGAMVKVSSRMWSARRDQLLSAGEKWHALTHDVLGWRVVVRARLNIASEEQPRD